MCHDRERMNLDQYKSVSILMRSSGPLIIMARNYEGLVWQTTPFFPSFDARNNHPTTKQPDGLKTEGKDYGIMRQVAERG